MRADKTEYSFSNNTSGALGYIILFALIVLYQYFDFNNSRNVLWGKSSDIDRGSVHLIIILLLSYGGFLYLALKGFLVKKRIITMEWIILLWITFLEFITGGSIWMICIRSGLAALWIFLFCISYIFSRNTKSSAKRMFFLFMLLLLGLSIYAFYYSYRNQNYIYGEEGGVFNLAYNVLAFLPFFLINVKNRINKACILIISIIIFISLKRGALISYIAMVSLYFVIKNKYDVKSRKSLFYLLFFFLFIVLGFLYVDSRTEGKMSERFSRQEIESGSGRSNQYSTAIQRWYTTSPVKQLFGEGASIFQSTFHIAIHNEFLSWLSYYGLVGLFLFCIFWIVMIQEQVALQRAASPYAKIHITILASFFVSSLVSGFYFMHSTMFYMITLGYIIGLEDQRFCDLHAVKQEQQESLDSAISTS